MKEIYLRLTKIMSHCHSKEIKWNNKRKALKNEIEFLK